MEKSEIIIQNDGVLIERTIKERELSAEQSVLDALTEPVKPCLCRWLSFRSAFTLETEKAHDKAKSPSEPK